MILKNYLNYSATGLATTIIYDNYKESEKTLFFINCSQHPRFQLPPWDFQYNDVNGV
jgi:hypothetical protein